MLTSHRHVILDDLPLRTCHRFDLPVDADGDVDPAVPSVPVDVLVGRAHHPCLGLVAGIHGDEYDGILALQQIRRELSPERLLGTLLLVTVANPFAFAAAQRCTPQDNVDLNRVFPGRADGSLTERLAKVLCQDVLRQADAVFTLHGSRATGVLSPWVEFLDVPGVVGQASYDLARASGFSDLIAEPVRPGRLLAALGELRVPLIEGEVGGRGTTRRENVAFYVERVCAVALEMGVVPDEGLPALEQAVPQIWRLGPDVVAEADGVFVREVALKQAVQAGERLGRILTARGDVAAEVRSPADGAIGGYRDHMGVRVGQTLFTLWTPAPALHVCQSAAAELGASVRRVSMDPEPIRREVHGILHSLDHMRRSDAYWLVGRVVDDVRQVLSRALGMIVAADVMNALVTLKAITDEYVAGWVILDDSDGHAGAFFAELGDAWEQAILAANLSPVERDAWRRKLTRWEKALEGYEVGDAFAPARIELED